MHTAFSIFFLTFSLFMCRTKATSPGIVYILAVRQHYKTINPCIMVFILLSFSFVTGDFISMTKMNQGRMVNKMFQSNKNTLN